MAAPICAQVLGDLGAEVIKVERPGTGDESRYYGETLARADGKPSIDSGMYLGTNRNKKGITVDIASPAGQDIIRRLAVKSDVLVENFRTGDLARYGLDEASMKALNPRLVYCSITGFGHTGPDRMQPGYDPIFQARGGWMSVNGETDETPIIVAANMVDTITGYFAAMSVLAALYHRDRADAPAGRGQSIDLALLDTALAAINVRAQDYLISGRQPPRRQNLNSVFPCADGNLVVSAGSNANWHSLCRVIERPDLGADERYATHAGRNRYKREIFAEVHKTTRGWKKTELAEALEAAQVPAAPVLDFQQAFDQPQAKARGLRRRARHASGQEVDLVANPIHFSDTPITDYRAPPQLSQHTDEVLRGLLELDETAITKLRSDGVI
jgi:crotonobetainyl-CoA:carnitine CoA-transferase CaiB-like acyl-CoA transferase